MKICSVCKEGKPLSEFHKNKSMKCGLNSSCKPCVSARLKKHYQNIKSDPQKLEKRLKMTSEYQKKNKDKRNHNLAKYRAKKLRATPSWLSGPQIAKIKRIYKLREIIVDATGTNYHVDHIVPLQGKNVCGLHVPWNLQVIPAEDNLKKNNTHKP